MSRSKAGQHANHAIHFAAIEQCLHLALVLGQSPMIRKRPEPWKAASRSRLCVRVVLIHPGDGARFDVQVHREAEDQQLHQRR